MQHTKSRKDRIQNVTYYFTFQLNTEIYGYGYNLVQMQEDTEQLTLSWQRSLLYKNQSIDRLVS